MSFLKDIEKTVNITAIEKKIKYTFKNKDLLILALIHSSYKVSLEQQNINNERLEFLGDAVIDLLTAEFLYSYYSSFDEGKLATIQSQIVSTKFFSQIINDLSLDTHLIMGKGEQMSQGNLNPSVRAGLLEAISGAIYLDSNNLTSVKSFIMPYIKKYLLEEIDIDNLKDYKTEFQEYCQKKYKVLPDYRIIKEFGPSHSKSFEISVYVNDKKISTAIGSSKKEASQICAKKALENIKKGDI